MMDPNSMDRNLLDYRDYRASTSWSDLLDEEARDKRPWKKVALAVFLCLAGAVMLTTGICLWYQAPGQGIGKGQQLVLCAVTQQQSTCRQDNSRCGRSDRMQVPLVQLHHALLVASA